MSLKDLKEICVLGMGLLGSSLTLAVSRAMGHIRCVGYSHRESTRQKARQSHVADEIFDDMQSAVSNSDIVILATPVRTFESIFRQISGSLKKGAIVTDVGSTKKLAHKWALNCLGQDVNYVGSHPIAGSEKRGLEYARDDLFFGARCIITSDKDTDPSSVKLLEQFWAGLGCSVIFLSACEHDRIFANVSHVPHAVAAALVNASVLKELEYAGKGFIDTSRVASGPENVWTDILMTNPENTARGLERVSREIQKLSRAVADKDEQQICKLLASARKKRSELIEYKIRNKELL